MSRATFFCDTTVLFAASDAAHQHHVVSLKIVATARPAHAFLAAHSLAELYATLSATPGLKVRSLPDVLEAVETAARLFTPVALGVSDYQRVIRHVAGVEARSGQIYDALILRAAEVSGADVVYTWNTRHFRRIAWAGMADRIRAPGS